LSFGIYKIFWLLLTLASLLMLASNFVLSGILSLCKRRIGRSPSCVESISIIIPAYDEEQNIEAKINSLWQSAKLIDLPIEVLIGSDGSRDRTVEVARSRLRALNAVNWKIVEFENEGKCNTLNKLVKMACGELIISTDADVAVPEDAIRLIIDAFAADAKLGCLSCGPILNSKQVGSQKHFWRIEDRVRNAESCLGRLIVVTGWLYAYRRNAYREIPKGVMADDLWIPLTFLLQGYDCVQLEELRVLSEVTDESMEIKRRKRVISGGMDVVRRLFPQLLRRPDLLLIVMAHKINRWALPLWLVIFAVATIAVFPYIFFAYVALAVVAFLVVGNERFMALMYAVFSPLLALFDVMTKTDFARWEHTRK